MTQRVRLWEVRSDQQPTEIPSTQIDLEDKLEDWLESDISMLGPGLLVIGRQVRTGFGAIDLLCLDSSGDTVVIELKRGKTPREVTSQALEYASWVKELSNDQITEIATRHFEKYSHSLDAAFQERFDEQLPNELNLSHRSLIVAEAMDASTERIVRYLSDMNVPINLTIVQHFKADDGKEMLARVYLIDPETADAKSRYTSKRTSRSNLTGLQVLADGNGIGPLYSSIRNGVNGILSGRALTQKNVGYAVKLDGGATRTVLIISAVPDEENGGLEFTAHASRFGNYLGVTSEELREWLPKNTGEADVTGWAGSSDDERAQALGLRGSFQDLDEVDKFLSGLRTIKATTTR